MLFLFLIYTISTLIQCQGIPTGFNGFNHFQNSCPCDQNNESNHMWVSWREPPRCSGRCHQAYLEGIFTCRFVFPNGTQLRNLINCTRVIPTNNCSQLCTAQWSRWSNHGVCSSECGLGKQEERRVCYKVRGSTFSVFVSPKDRFYSRDTYNCL